MIQREQEVVFGYPMGVCFGIEPEMIAGADQIDPGTVSTRGEVQNRANLAVEQGLEAQDVDADFHSRRSSTVPAWHARTSRPCCPDRRVSS